MGINAMQSSARTLTGRPTAPGYGVGMSWVLGSGKMPVPNYPISEVEPEQRRFERALQAACWELECIHAGLSRKVGNAVADIFAAHLALLKDQRFLSRVHEVVSQQRVNVERAVQVTIDELAAKLAAVDNEYLRQREQDIRDMGRRVLRHLIGAGDQACHSLCPQTVIVASELLPSDFLELDRSCIVGVVTEQGGETSHGAILARSLGIPAVTGVQGATLLIESGQQVAVDGQTGTVLIEPSRGDLRTFVMAKERYEHALFASVVEQDQDCVTRDGISIQLLANIARAHEVTEVQVYHLAGVGLFRTEYLFMNEAGVPDLVRQVAVLRSVASSLGELPLVVRTLDLGADKWPPFMERSFEANPNLGMRGLRFALSAVPELFQTQLEALLQVAQEAPVQVLFPMVLGVSDLLQAIAVMDKIARAQSLPKRPLIGAMIETPAAVFSIDQILEHVDFVSLGTNDLTQFMLATDRNAATLMNDYSVMHPGNLRAIAHVVQNAWQRGRAVSVCGEAAGDPGMAAVLVGLGVRQLSMSPNRSLAVRYTLRQQHIEYLEKLAKRALDCVSVEEVVGLITELMPPQSGHYPPYVAGPH